LFNKRLITIKEMRNNQNSVIDLEDLYSMSLKNFPLCMQLIFEDLKRNKYIKFDARF